VSTNDPTMCDAPERRWWHRATAWASGSGEARPFVRAGRRAAAVVLALGVLSLLVALMAPTASESQDPGLGLGGSANAALPAAPGVPAVPPVPLTSAPAPSVTSTTIPVTTTPTAPPTPPTPPPTPAPTLPPAPAGDPPVVVPSQVAWTDSGIDVSQGDLVHFSASGTVLHAAPDASTQVGPSGDPDPARAWANLQVNGVPMGGNHAGLIGRIGDGEPFVLGRAGTIAVPGGGRLFLGVNDNGVDNNEGSFEVAIEVQAG